MHLIVPAYILIYRSCYLRSYFTGGEAGFRSFVRIITQASGFSVGFPTPPYGWERMVEPQCAKAHTTTRPLEELIHKWHALLLCLPEMLSETSPPLS